MENKLFLSAISLLLGIIIKTIFDKVLNKTKIVQFTVYTDRIAISGNDPIFGNVKVEWQGHAVNNLYNTVIEIENTTSTDYENIPLKIWSGNDILILNERTEISETTQIVEWSDSYKKQISLQNGEQATEQQNYIYNHQREYNIKVFNRGQKLQFTYLSTLLNNNSHHGIWVEMIYPGLKFKQQFQTIKIHDVLSTQALPLGLIALLFILLLSILYIDSIWIASIVCMISGLMAQSIGAYIYKTFNFIRNLIIR